jgi:hypothetical protein
MTNELYALPCRALEHDKGRVWTRGCTRAVVVRVCLRVSAAYIGLLQ